MSLVYTSPLPLAPFGPIHTPVLRRPTHRVVKGLELAWEHDDPPGRPKGWRKTATKAQLEGDRFERAAGKLLEPGARHGAWFGFMDTHGRGNCQPDWLMVLPGRVVLVLECKRTECPEATTQLTQLYFPVVERALGLRPIGIVVVKYLTLTTPLDRLCGDFSVALNAALCGRIPILHWSPK